VHIITRVLGIVLAALAVQYVLNGLTGYYYSLVGRSAWSWRLPQPKKTLAGRFYWETIWRVLI